MKELVIAADRNNLLKVQSFIDEQFGRCRLSDADANCDRRCGWCQRAQKGGPGIYMVKNSTDDTRYEYREGKNILTIKKNLN